MAFHRACAADVLADCITLLEALSVRIPGYRVTALYLVSQNADFNARSSRDMNDDCGHRQLNIFAINSCTEQEETASVHSEPKMADVNIHW